MKTAIKLILIYLGLQILSAVFFTVPTMIYAVFSGGDPAQIDNSMLLAPAMYLAITSMTIYLWKAGYISTDKFTWSPVSGLYLFLSVLVCLPAMAIVEFLLSMMPWLPNIMEQTFNILQSGWAGILVIAIFGPGLEELMFRGAITQKLLGKYSPRTAIFLSALVFGIFHINPVQVVTAFFIGLLLAWIYYKTASLIPCILIHIVNNSLSVYLSLKYPKAEGMSEIVGVDVYYIAIAVAVVVLSGTILIMNRTTVSYPWKEEIQDNELNKKLN